MTKNLKRQREDNIKYAKREREYILEEIQIAKKTKYEDKNYLEYIKKNNKKKERIERLFDNMYL